MHPFYGHVILTYVFCVPHFLTMYPRPRPPFAEDPGSTPGSAGYCFLVTLCEGILVKL